MSRKVSIDKNLNLFSYRETVNIVNKPYGPINGSLNTVMVSKDLFEKYGSVAVLYAGFSNDLVEVFNVVDETLPEKTVKLTLRLFERFYCTDDETIEMLKYNNMSFSNYKTQKVELLKEDNISVSTKVYEQVVAISKKCKNHLFSLYNSLTGENLVVKKSHIKPDVSLTDGCIRLSRIQRIFVGLEPREYLPDIVYNYLISHFNENDAVLETVFKAFDSKSRLLKKDVSYEEKMAANKAIQQNCHINLILTPVFESIGKRKRRTVFRVLADFYVGKSTMSLVCKRPYEADEGKDIIRLSKNNMNLLGIESMDKVRLTFRNKTTVCRVLELEQKESFNLANLPVSADNIAGVPVNVRNKLGILNIDSCIKIDRNTGFIFIKSLNEQIVPILLTLFSSNFLTNFSVWKTAVVSLVLAPFVVYVNLSSKRNMRLK